MVLYRYSTLEGADGQTTPRMILQKLAVARDMLHVLQQLTMDDLRINGESCASHADANMKNRLLIHLTGRNGSSRWYSPSRIVYTAQDLDLKQRAKSNLQALLDVLARPQSETSGQGLPTFDCEELLNRPLSIVTGELISARA